MTTTMPNGVDKFTARKIVLVTLSIFWKRKFLFLVTAAIVMFGADQFTGKIIDWFESIPKYIEWHLRFFEFFLAYSILRGSLTYAAYREMGGQPISFRELSERVRLLPFSRSVWSPISVCLLYVLIPNTLFFWYYLVPDASISIVLLVGILIWSWLHIVFYTVVPVAVHEDVSVSDSFRHAFRLSSGFRWAIFRANLLLYIPVSVMIHIVVIIAVLILDAYDLKDKYSTADDTENLIFLVIGGIIGGLYAMLDSIVSTVCYGYLRHRKFSGFCADS